MDEVELLDKLDKTLSYILNTKDGTTMKDFISNNPELWAVDSQRNMAFDKLVYDKYIKPDPNDGQTTIYRATIIGLTFMGYEKQRKAIHDENTQRDTLETELRVNRRWLLCLTVLIAVGTLVAAIYYGIEIWKDIFCKK